MAGISQTATRLALLVGLTVGLAASPASARAEGESKYSKEQTYSGALRYLRVDLGYEILEKDADAAYLIFRYLPPGDSKRSLNGTVEVVETRDAVRLYVQLPQMPEYHERVLRDGLMKKLRSEYGAPPVKSKKPEARPDDRDGNRRPSDGPADDKRAKPSEPKK